MAFLNAGLRPKSKTQISKSPQMKTGDFNTSASNVFLQRVSKRATDDCANPDASVPPQQRAKMLDFIRPTRPKCRILPAV